MATSWSLLSVRMELPSMNHLQTQTSGFEKRWESGTETVVVTANRCSWTVQTTAAFSRFAERILTAKRANC